MAQSGQNRKKAIVIISDGNDTSSRVGVSRSEADGARDRSAGLCGRHRRPGHADVSARPTPPVRQPRRACRFRFRSRAAARRWRTYADAGCGGDPYPPSGGGGRGGTYSVGGDDRVNVVALREITDDSGGRTEIVRDPRDLDPAAASIADELSQQYYLGYPSPGYKDGRWHTIRVELRDPALRCARARDTSRRLESTRGSTSVSGDRQDRSPWHNDRSSEQCSPCRATRFGGQAAGGFMKTLFATLIVSLLSLNTAFAATSAEASAASRTANARICRSSTTSRTKSTATRSSRSSTASRRRSTTARRRSAAG